MKGIVNIKLIYLATVFQNLCFAYVIERLFWESRGMSIKEVVYTEIIYVTLISLLEVPSGFLADKLKRKALLFTSVLFTISEIAITIYAHTFFTLRLLSYQPQLHMHLPAAHTIHSFMKACWNRGKKGNSAESLGR